MLEVGILFLFGFCYCRLLPWRNDAVFLLIFRFQWKFEDNDSQTIYNEINTVYERQIFVFAWGSAKQSFLPPNKSFAQKSPITNIGLCACVIVCVCRMRSTRWEVRLLFFFQFTGVIPYEDIRQHHQQNNSNHHFHLLSKTDHNYSVQKERKIADRKMRKESL